MEIKLTLIDYQELQPGDLFTISPPDIVDAVINKEDNPAIIVWVRTHGDAEQLVTNPYTQETIPPDERAEFYQVTITQEVNDAAMAQNL